MQVKNHLSATFFHVEKQFVAGLRYALFSSHCFGHHDQLSDNAVVRFSQVIDTANVALGYDQDVDRRVRLDVPENNHLIVFE